MTGRTQPPRHDAPGLSSACPETPACRCAGTGTYTAVYSLGHSVLMVDKPCPAGCLPQAVQQPPDAPEETP